MVDRFVQREGFRQTKSAALLFLLLFVLFLLLIGVDFLLYLSSSFLFITLRTGPHHLEAESKCIALKGVGVHYGGPALKYNCT
jgi:maltodextrin utilization protein YvdJ